MPEPDTATYVYCLIAGAPPEGAALPDGLPDLGPTRLLEVSDDRWLMVADAPTDVYGVEGIAERLDDIEWVSHRGAAHAEVVGHFLGRATVLPMKLFTLFSSDERAIAEVRERRARVDEVIERVAGHVEWGVRVHFDEAEARRVVREQRAGARDSVSGKEFLQRKKSARDAGGALLERARAGADEAIDRLGDRAAEVRRLAVPPTGAASRAVADAAFLVAEADAETFERAVTEAAGDLAEVHCNLVLNGPWPPYNFVTMEPDPAEPPTADGSERTTGREAD